MAKKTIKETLLGTLVHGKEILNNIRVLRAVSPEKISPKPVTAAADVLHPKELHLTVSSIIDTGKEAKIIRLIPTEGMLPPFEAGQYIHLFADIDGVRTGRPYSLSSSPRQRAYYEITVAKMKDSFVSDFLLNRLREGDRLTASGPAGVFHFQPVFHRKKSLFLAGGSGITPFLSMIREIIDAGLDRDVVLLYGCRNESVALYHEELSDAAARFPNFRYHLVLSEPLPGQKGETGFLNQDLIKRLVPDYADRTVYICGPQVMNDFCQNESACLGLQPKQVRRELFGIRRDIQNEPGWPSDLTGNETFSVRVGERTIPAKSSEPILVALERAGIRVSVCCRSGECSLCRVRLISGPVFLAQGMLRRYADEKFGYIHSCKAYPIGDIEIALPN